VNDKPGKYPDPYHTAYGLAGCGIAQHKSDYENLHADTEHAKQFSQNFTGNYEDMVQGEEQKKEIEKSKTVMLGNEEGNKIRRMHPIYNVRFDYAAKARAYYRQNDLETRL
jgi:prenyltransferase beta subunit